jgi:hypothetical protein
MDLEKFLNPSDKWDIKYRRAVIAAIRQYRPDRAAEIIERYLSPARRAEFNLTNTYARRIFRRQLLLWALDLEMDLFRPGIVVMWATIADHNWTCCDRNINFNYREAKQKIRNAFTGMNFIGVIEPGYYPNVKWDRGGRVGCLVSFHAHIVVWDSSESKLRRHQRRVKVRFLPVDRGDRSTPRLDNLKTLEDLMKVLRYSTKMPFEGYDKEEKTKQTDKKADHQGSIEQANKKVAVNYIEQSHVKLQAIHQLRLFAFMRKHSLFDAWLGGGDGAKLLREARKSALKVARRS